MWCVEIGAARAWAKPTSVSSFGWICSDLFLSAAQLYKVKSLAKWSQFHVMYHEKSKNWLRCQGVEKQNSVEFSMANPKAVQRRIFYSTTLQKKKEK
jgi:hypothetical protein